MNAPVLRRPVLRYLGGKWKLAPWIVSHFPAHRVYVEPFGGAASVLLRKPRPAVGGGECYNDLDGSVVNLFRVLRDPASAADLAQRVALTPFAREEYDLAFRPAHCPVERARRLIVRSYMGHGSSSAIAARQTGFRASMINRKGALPANEWPGLPSALLAVHDRIQGVLIEQRPALSLIDRYDTPDTLIYLDPPYVPETRSMKRRGGEAFHAYAHEMTEDDHAQLLLRARQFSGMVVISGYPSRLYDMMLSDWQRHEKQAHADGALKRTEVLWLNPAAANAVRMGAAHG